MYTTIIITRISSSDKDLPVHSILSHHEIFEEPPTSSFLASIIDFLVQIIVMDTGKSLSEALAEQV